MPSLSIIQKLAQPIEIVPKCKRQIHGMGDNCALCEYDTNKFYKDCSMRGNKQ